MFGETLKVEPSLIHCIKTHFYKSLLCDKRPNQATIFMFSDQETGLSKTTCTRAKDVWWLPDPRAAFIRTNHASINYILKFKDKVKEQVKTGGVTILF